jgi:hypothetical protein
MFRFTIRELLLLMLVIAMGVGWWAVPERAVAVKGRRGAVRSLLLRGWFSGWWIGGGVLLVDVGTAV